MDKWDEEKLRSVVLSKHGNPRTTTDVRLHIPVTYPVINLFVTTDRLQILHTSDRVGEVCVPLVRRYHRSSMVSMLQVRVVLGMS